MNNMSMPSKEMANKHLTKDFAASAMVGVPRAVSDDEIMTEYPQPKRRRDSSTVDREMEIEIIVPVVTDPLPSQDDVLTEMIHQSGARSYAEIVSFCVESGIPLSRMFRLDLLRQVQPHHR